MKELFSLYYAEWTLLEKTIIGMQRLSNKARATGLVLELWKGNLENNVSNTSEQSDLIYTTLEEWFKEEKYITDLHKEWKKFFETANEFKERFDQSAMSISKIVTHQLKTQCEKLLPHRREFWIGILSLATGSGVIGGGSIGITSGVLGVGITKAAYIVGAVAATTVFSTGIIVAGAVVGAGLLAYGGYLVHKKYKQHKKIKQEVNDVLKNEEKVGEDIMHDLTIMVKNAKEIRNGLCELAETLEQQVGKNKELEIVLKFVVTNEKLKQKVIEILENIITSLGNFEQKCKEIKKLAKERKSQFVK